MTIGERISQRRQELGLTADEVASELGKSRATVYRYENGDIEKFPVDALEPIAKVLKTTPQYLMGWENSDDQKERSAPELSETDRKAIELFQQMDEQSKQTFIQLMKDRLK